MSKVSDFAQQEGAKLTEIQGAVGSIATGVKNLDDLINQLQNTPGEITPEDQALLDQIQAQSNDLLAQVQAIDTAAPAKPTPSV